MCGNATGALTIPPSVTEINDRAFNSCERLSSLTFLSSQNPLTLTPLNDSANRAFGNLFFTNLETLTPLTDISILTRTGGDQIFTSLFNNSRFYNANRSFFYTYYYWMSTEIDQDTVDFAITNVSDSVGDQIAMVEIGNSIASIGTSAFLNVRDSLTEVNFGFGGQLRTIEYNAFRLCTRLTSIDLEYCTRLQHIGVTAFRECSAASNSLMIPNTVTLIGENAFFNCGSLVSINLANAGSLQRIGQEAFSGCTSATGVLNIPSQVGRIGPFAFENCSQLGSINLENASALSFISRYAFNNCKNATGSLTIPTSVGWIASQAFERCTSLNEVSFVQSITNVALGDPKDPHPFVGLGFTNASLGSSLEDIRNLNRSSGAVVFTKIS